MVELKILALGLAVSCATIFGWSFCQEILSWIQQLSLGFLQ